MSSKTGDTNGTEQHGLQVAQVGLDVDGLSELCRRVAQLLCRRSDELKLVVCSEIGPSSNSGFSEILNYAQSLVNTKVVE